jgi:hypothetical protein
MPRLDPAALPTGSLSMAALVSLEPPALRRLLKSGLRRGLSSEELQGLLEQDWQCSLGSPEAATLLLALEQRGWLRQVGDRWKTRLG